MACFNTNSKINQAGSHPISLELICDVSSFFLTFLSETSFHFNLSMLSSSKEREEKADP